MKSSNNITCNRHVVVLHEASRHLAISMPMIRETLQSMGCCPLPNKRCDLADVWRRIWCIDAGPLGLIPQMQQQLYTVEWIASYTCVTTQTIRRAGNNRDPKWNLPDYYDLGPRTRRYLPLHVETWLCRQPMEPWLERRCGSRTAIGMTARSLSDSGHSAQVEI